MDAHSVVDCEAPSEIEAADNIYIPQVSIGRVPKIGQEFESHEEAYKFYNQYAREAGFSARIANSKKKKESTYWKLFVCSKEGKTNDSWQRKYKDTLPRIGERKRGQTRIGCNARLSVVKQQTGNIWVVNKFISEHNHGLTTPSRVHLLRSHRNVSTTKKALTQQLAEANIPTCQQVRLLEIDSGGPSSLGFVERDIRNNERNIREEHRGHDAETLVEYFTFEKEKSSNFFFDFETDMDKRLVRCFWADSESRRSYAIFGDAVVFDTTYNTNKYSMIFAPFVGVNHHGQTIIFACGLLSDETTESFVWLFSRFLKAMHHQSPKIIITDQDAAISKAISMVFSDTFHRYCIWHILNKFSEKINVIVYNEQYHRLVDIIKNSETPEEFEQRWSGILETTNLDCNAWLCSMYEIRHRWVPAYVKHVFSAGMSSSQRSESNHSFLKRYINRKNSLMDFITRFTMALRHQRHDELVANHIDLNERPRLTSVHMMEHQVVEIYTKYMFLVFQKEFEQSNFYICSKKSENSDSKVYGLERFDGGKLFEKRRELIYFLQTDYVSCSCRMFEFVGCPCRHILCYLKKKQVLILPSKYILRRWTKSAKVGSVAAPLVLEESSNSLLTRHGMLSHMASVLVDEASLTEARSKFLFLEFEALQNRVKEIDNGVNATMSGERSRSRGESQGIIDPIGIRTKGCGKRLKSSKERALSKGARTCRGCGQHGHDRRTCPQLHDNYQNTQNEEDGSHEGEREFMAYMSEDENNY